MTLRTDDPTTSATQVDPAPPGSGNAREEPGRDTSEAKRPDPPADGLGSNPPQDAATTTAVAPVTQATAKARPKRSIADRVEAWVSRLSSRNNFWHRVCSMFWLPYAFRSGIRMKRVDSSTFTAVLPFRKFNRNWYNAMAGAALLGNSEIAGGMYVFGICGGDYTVVCKHLEYKFLRPCFGPAIYRINPREPIEPLLESKEEFNITLDLEIVQSIPPRGTKPAGRERRVGRCTVTFHVTPKSQHKARKARNKRD